MPEKKTKKSTKRTPKTSTAETPPEPVVETPDSAPVTETAEKGALLRFRSNGL